MRTNITYAGFEVAPGSKLQTYLPVKDSDVKVPVTIINGKEDGKQIVFTSGVQSWH